MSRWTSSWFVVGGILMTIDAAKGDYIGAAKLLGMATVGAILIEYVIRAWRRHL